MATLEQMMTALRNADASGNTQDAKRLAQLIQQTRKPADTSLLTGMQNSLYRAGQGIADAIPTAVSALTGMENPRLVIDKGGDGFQLSDLSTLQFKDASALTPEVEASNPLGIQGDPFRETADSISKARSDLNYAPKVSWEEVKSNPNSANVLGFMGEQAITSLPDMAMVMLSTPAYFLSYVAPIANERAKNNGTAVPTPADLAYAATAAVTIAQAEKFGAKGIFGGTTGNFVTRPLKAGAKESVTEAIQSPVEYAGGTLGTEAGFDPMVAADQSLAGAVGGAGAGTGIRTTLDVTGGAVNLVSGGDTKVGDQEAASDVANDIQRIADAAGHDLMDVDPSSAGGAKQAVMDVHAEYAETMKALAADIKQRLGYDDSDTEAQRLDKILAKTALRKGRNVAKNIVNKDDFAAVERLAGDTGEGQQLINYLKRSNELTRVNDAGFKGGLSRITDVFNPFDMNQGYSPARNTISAMSGLLSGGAAISTQGASLPLQAAAVGTGRLIDKATGRRSKVARYIKQNAGEQGLAVPDAPLSRAEREAERQREEADKIRISAIDKARKAILEAQRKAANRALGQRGALATPGSPQDTMERATGMDKSGVAAIMRQLDRIETNPAILKAMEEYRTSIDTGGEISNDMLSPLIKAVNTQIDAIPNNQNKRVRPPERGVEATAETQLEARLEQGKRDNAQRIKILQDALAADNTVNDADRAVIGKALEVLGLNLGENPVNTAEAILDEAYARARNKDKVSQYVLPYVERVRQQQKGKTQTNQDMDIAPINFTDVFGIGDDVAMTAIDMMPTDAELAQMKAGTFKPEQKQLLVEAYGAYHERWKQAAGQDTPLEYNGVNIERIGAMMATEALKAVERDGSAIGWYDAKLKAAKSVMRLVEPRIDDNEAAFDFALAVTSNGQAVTENFKYALDVFRTYLDNGAMPENFKQGGKRNKAMRNAFKFYNAWERSGQNQSIAEFLDTDFTVRELNQFIDAFNKKNKTNLSVGSSENQDTTVKGSFILGAKIGQGFYQNIRGNYDPLTMDIWWMRMWNRLVGRPFEPPSQERDILKRRNIIKRGIIDNKDKDMRKVVNEALAATGETRSGLYSDPVRFDNVIVAIGKSYQRFYEQYQKKNGKNHDKPDWLATVGTHIDKMGDKLMASPAGGGERTYMRLVTARARELLKEQGYDINTADFQALMWYPEKQLAEKMGIAKGKGEDNDYLDAAILSARNEGITDGQIQEALPDAERERFNSGASAGGQDGRPGSGSSRIDAPEEGTSINEDRDAELLKKTDEELLKILDSIEFTTPSEYRARASDLISRLTKMTEPEFGMVMERVRDAKRRSLPKAIKRLDPEGRQTMSIITAGLNGEGLTNEEVEMIFPFLVNAFDTLLANDRGVSGLYRTGSELLRGDIRMRPLDDLDPEYWLKTFFHEFGHAIESQSGLRNEIRSLKNLLRNNMASDEKRAEAENVLDQFIELSRQRRPSLWEQVDGNHRSLQTLVSRLGLSASVPTPKQIALMQPAEYRDFASALGAAMDEQGIDSYKLVAELLPELKGQIDYLHSEPELSADGTALYMQKPQVIKKYYGDAAAIIRKVVNNSAVGDFITFHSLAGLLGAGTLAAILADGEDDENKGVLSLGSGALSAA